uniref:Conserved oligomeric Golgi complex subunit 6 n=1 Tax=Schistocephalus solidus TaxID=70667 RepID=A0A0X3Q0M1_SCHSO
MSLKVISEIYHNNSVRDRRNLRSSIEKQRLQLADSVLNDIDDFKHNLDDLSSELDAMLTSCETINSKLQASKSRMEKIVMETNLNQSRRLSINLAQIAASAFIKSFYISPEDWGFLNEPPSQAVSDRVLQLLQRARTTQRLFETSIRYPTTILAKDIVKVTACFVDKAYEQIYNWVKREVSAQCFEAIEISVVLRKCLEVLQDRPILFKYVLDEYANARRKVIAEAFINALTVGWNSGSGFEPVATKPMELQSHDPLRYAGDMLAWLHQASASEREYFKSLTSDKVEIELMHDCLNNITNGLAYPLQLHLEQLLVTEHSAVLLYKINNILQFYSSVIMNLLGEKCTVYATLSELQSLSWNLFISALQQETLNLLSESEFPRHDFMPSTSALEACRLLEAILTCQDMSYAAPDVRQTKCEQIVEVVVKPLLEHFETMAGRFGEVALPPSRKASATTVSPAPPPPSAGQSVWSTEAQVYLLNCLNSVYASLSRLEFTGVQIAEISQRLEDLLSSLTAEQTQHVLFRTNLCGLWVALQRGHDPQVNGPLSIRADLPEAGVSEPEVQNAIAAFNAFLASPDSLDLPELQSIAYPRPRNTIRKRVADQLHTAYTTIYAALTDPANGYESIEFALKTPQEVAELILNA